MSDISLEQEENYYKLFVDKTEVGGAWVGYTSAVMPKDFMGRNHKVIMGFSIKPEYRQNGYGKILMEEIVQAEKKIETKTLRLGVEIDNEPAIKIYTGAGFDIDGNINEGMHYMWKEL